MKKVFLLLAAIFLVSALVFAGCAAPTPTPVPLQPAITVTPSQAPAPKPAPAPAQSASPTSAPAQKPIELKFAHHNPPNAFTTVVWLNAWAKQVEEATKGRVKVVMYPARTLAAETQTLEAVQFGISDMAWVVGGVYPGRFPLLEVGTLPFLCRSSGKVNGETYSGGKVNSRIAWEMNEQFPEMQAQWKDVKLLTIVMTDPAFIITTKKPVSTVADMKGLKIRGRAGGQGELLKAVQASLVNLEVPDVYDSASRGIIDATTTSWSQIATYRFFEVFKYYTIPGIAGESEAIIMNKDKWNSLPADIQQAIMSVSGLKGSEFGGDAAFGFEPQNAAFAAMKKAGYEMTKVEITPEELQKWSAIGGKPVWDAWVKSRAAGLPAQKVLEAQQQLVEKYKP